MASKILIIDDDIDLVEVLRITLEIEGFEVIDAQEGERGYRLVVEERPDLIILDVMMTTTDEGFAVAQRIRANPEIAHTKIIMLTAVSQELGFKYEKDDDLTPVDEFIEKPILPDRLIHIIKKHLNLAQ